MPQTIIVFLLALNPYLLVTSIKHKNESAMSNKKGHEVGLFLIRNVENHSMRWVSFQTDRELSSGTWKDNINIKAGTFDLNQTSGRGRQRFSFHPKKYSSPLWMWCFWETFCDGFSSRSQNWRRSCLARKLFSKIKISGVNKFNADHQILTISFHGKQKCWGEFLSVMAWRPDV